MTEKQWETLRSVAAGRTVQPTPAGFIIDSPWLPQWSGVSILDYMASENVWLQSNLMVQKRFPELIFLPGFWSEYGMCTEPSAFGSKCSFPENEFPHPAKLLHTSGDIEGLTVPDPRRDGLLPLVIKRLAHLEPKIRENGHQVYFAVSRGPLNIAAFLMGTTEFLMTMKLEPERAHMLLAVVTDFISRWLAYQRECFPSIDGIMLLDDIVGFIGREDFLEFADPYFKRLYSEHAVSIKLFHNDAPCEASAPFYAGWGVNLFNPGVQSSLEKVMELTGPSVAILGNIPPRDVLAQSTPAGVAAAVRELLAACGDSRRLIISCAGGMPPGVSSENLDALISAGKSP